MAVELDFTVPSSDLSGYVTLFYHFRTDLARFEDVERAGHAQLRFRLTGANGCYAFADGSRQDVGPVHLIGPTTGPTLSGGDGPLELVGMGLSPAGWAALIRSDASTMVNRAIDCDNLFENLGEVVVALRAAPTTAAKVAVLEEFVRKAAAGRGSDAIMFAQLVDCWLTADPSPQIQDLERTTGLSRRQVERRCNALYGAPPKVLARKYRALRAAVNNCALAAK